MNLFGLNISRSHRSNSAPAQKTLSPEALAWLTGSAPHSGPLLTNAYEQVVWVYRAVNVLAESVANIPFRFSVGANEGENLISTGPLVNFYEHPHPHINGFQYWELRVIWLMLRGECFRIPVFEGRRLVRVLILDPANFQHIIQDHQLIGWRYTGLGQDAPLSSQLFLPEEVWFEKLPNPFDFWRGMAPLLAASTAAQTDFAASAFMKGLIENNGDLGLIVRTDAPLGAEQKAQIRAELAARRHRAGAANTPLVISNAELVTPRLSSSDLQFLENRRFSRAEICAAFGVPEEIITTTEKAKYDVMEGTRLNFIENRIAPLCRRLQADEQATVRCIHPRATGWFDLDSLPILQNARRSRLQAAKTGFDMGIPFNELNRVFDLGFRPLPGGNVGYLPERLVPSGPPLPEL